MSSLKYKTKTFIFIEPMKMKPYMANSFKENDSKTAVGLYVGLNWHTAFKSPIRPQHSGPNC